MKETNFTQATRPNSNHENLEKATVAPRQFRYRANIQITSKPFNASCVISHLHETLTALTLKDDIFSELIIEEVGDKLYSIKFALLASTWKDASRLSQALTTEAYHESGLTFEEDDSTFKTEEKTYFYKNGSLLTSSSSS
jgi:hypothetical protein